MTDSQAGSDPLMTLADEVAAWWPLTDVVVPRVIREFGARTVALLRAGEGEFVVKVDGELGRDVDEAAQFQVLVYLEVHAFLHSPRLVRTRTGGLGARTSGGVACVLEYVPHALQPTAAQWRELGVAAAAVNALSGARPFAIAVDAAIEELRARAHGHRFGHEMQVLLSEAEVLADLPTVGLIHGEINCANGARRADGTTVLLDWDHAGAGPTALEYGYPLITQFVAESTHRVDIAAAHSFYGAYRDHGGEIDREQCFSAAVLHALRYMWWGDIDKRWRRIQFVAENAAELLDEVLP